MIRTVAYPRTGLVGNPSDLLHGRTISLLLDAFQAEVTITESERIEIERTNHDGRAFAGLDELVHFRREFGYYGGIRIIEATIVRLHRHCQRLNIQLDGKRSFHLAYSSNIPFRVGLAGSSAIARATLVCLMKFYDLADTDIPLPIQANIILEAETLELGIVAGPQDRVVSIYGGLVYMDFTRDAFERNYNLYGDYKRLDPANLPRLYVAYDERLSESSGRVHGNIQRRPEDQKKAILRVMAQKAELVEEARVVIERADKDAIGPLMTRDFELRRSVYDLAPMNLEMVETARHNGSHAKQCGSGGAIVGTFTDDEHLLRVTQAFQLIGCQVVEVRVATYA